MPACFVYLPLLAWLIIPMQWEWYLLGVKIPPWRLYLFCSSLLSCFNFICLCFLPESPKFLLSIDKKAETIAVLQRMYEINTGNAQEVGQHLRIWRRTTRIIFCAIHFVFADIPRERCIFRIDRHQFVGCTGNQWCAATIVESNVAAICATTLGKYNEIVLFDVPTVFGRPRNVYVVRESDRIFGFPLYYHKLKLSNYVSLIGFQTFWRKCKTTSIRQ